MELEPGTQVTPTVRLVEPLGVGGMGSVWVAYHATLETNVAVKFISPSLIKEDSSILDRFNREATLAAQIKSPHVVQTFDHGIMSDGRPYIVMERLEGETLAERVAGGAISVQMTQLVIAHAAKALSRAHVLGIVHRDIKPDNLFLTSNDDELFVKVLDFGIAKRANVPASKDVTGTGAMIGTPEYMSPEQVLSAKSVDFRADLWALGVVAYHCLTGVVPFTGETLGSLCVSIASGKFIPPTTIRPELPPTLDTWFEKALAIDPLRRFASAKELALSFAAALSGAAIDGLLTSHTGKEKAPDWSGAHPARPSGDGAPSGELLPREAHAATFAGTTLATARPTRTRIALGIVAAAIVAATAVIVVLVNRTPAPSPATGDATTRDATSSLEELPPNRGPAAISTPPTATATPARASASNAPSSSTGQGLAAKAPTPATSNVGPKIVPPLPTPKTAPSKPKPNDRGF